MEFDQLNLGPQLMRAIQERGYDKPTPIQEQAIPVVLDGRDVIASAQTGTGKTAAYALPALQMLEKSGKGWPRVLVLAPTRELAIQVDENFRGYGKYLDLRTALLYGGVGYGKQNQDLQNKPDVVVATPGRLLDYLNRRALRLDKLEFLVLDEVDRMFDMGFIEDVTTIVNKTSRKRQTLMFSATIPEAVKRLSKWALRNPEEIAIDIRISPAETVEHALYPVAGIQKFDLLVVLLEQVHFESVIIFFKTRVGTDRISRWLKAHGHSLCTLHSDINQRDRAKALSDFKAGKVKILTATDVASRGLDITSVTHVINYDVPQHPEDYVHRIGRTGRAYKEGFGYTFFSSDETELVLAIERFIGQEIPRERVDDFEYREETVVSATPTTSRKKRNRGFGMGGTGKRRRGF
ncbi:MAG: RNA helicase [Opitutales bacterium]|jgi:ATP-dependent RNA helicase RhlE|nr:RNA helicase [Opitutales bacterium]MDP7301601.1 DEAD/DEAH box helicase [Pirellulaceae bacterium]